MASSTVSSTSSVARSHRSPPQPVSQSPSPSPARPLAARPGAAADDVLIGHLLASKRSLNSVAHLHRASAIIAEARSTLESTAIVSARAAFLKRSLASQLRILESVHSQLSSLARQAQEDFSVVLKELDDADAGLETELDGLRNTTVERAFRPKGDGEKTLVDFVDEKPVEEIRESLRGAIDGLNGAIKVLEEENQTFGSGMESIQEALSTHVGGTGGDSTDSFKPGNSSLAASLHVLEGHAKEMAVGLESLVKHFDLCVTAIRHTEGGGAAAQNLTGDLPEGLDMGQRDLEAPPPQPISEEEYAEMLTIVHNDAPEVEEVVVEIQDRIGEMELQLDQILAWRDRTTTTSTNVHLACQRLEQIGAKLPLYTSRATTFITGWTELQNQISADLTSLSDLRDVYANYLSAYDGLIIEVARRKTVSLQMQTLVREAHSRLEKLYETDMTEREAFRQDQGDYLPGDIWPGLADPPARYAFSKSEDSGGSIPELSRETIEEASIDVAPMQTQPNI